MKERSLAATLLLFTAVAAAPAIRSSPTVEVDRAPSDLQDIMQAISGPFRGLEDGLLRRDASLVTENARALRLATGRLTAQPAPDDADSHSAFRFHANRVKGFADEIETLASKDELAIADQAFDDMRRSCVDCHVSFRSAVDGRNLFPAKQNSITGHVRVVKADGAERKDCSNVVVFLDGVPADAEFPLPRSEPAISQKDRQFTPRVLPILKGTTVTVPNDDEIFHNAFSLSKTKPFDLGTYEPGESRSVRFTESGLVRLYCNIHPEMVGCILVLENPYFTVTDDRGLFVISEVPDGDYVLRAWNENGGEARDAISIRDGSIARASLEVKEDRNVIGHTNKYGKPYRRKYQ